ncbi:MAG: hypothetical protein ABWZ25_19185 [Chitinophagaceae bacterium]
MKHTLAFGVCLLIASFFIVSCKKGDVGPPGTANVKYSAWFTPTTYKKDTVFGIWGFNYTQAAPEITQQIIDTGTVLTFGKLLGYNPAVWPANQISQLPINISYVQSGATQTDTWSALVSPGNLKIRFVNNNNIYTSIATQHQFRYIIIPGSVLTGRARTMSYREICEKYNIPE